MSILLATVSVLIGFAAGVMYLGQSRRLKHKLPPISGLRLPSLEWLEKTNSRAIVVSALMMSVGVVSGIIMKVIKDRSGVPWTDPVVLSSGLMLGWLVAAMVLGSRYRPARHGRKVAYLTIVSFLFLLIALGVFIQTQHGGGEPESEVGRQEPGVRTGLQPTASGGRA